MKKKVLAGIMTTAMIMAMITQAFRFAYEPLQKIHRHQPEVKHPQTAVRQKVIIPSVFLSLQSTVLLITAAKDSWKV